MKIGVLAVQGAFIEHEKMLEALGAECIELRKKEDITDNELDGLVFPGGESTVQGKLLRELDMFDDIKKLIEEGKPVLATCAGLILLADHIAEDSTVHLASLPVRVKRNAYGRQLGSFVRKEKVKELGEFEMTFIRAPYIEKTESEEVEVLAEVDGKIVAVQYRNQIALSFHPEMGQDMRIHEKFLKLVRSKKGESFIKSA